MENIKSVVDQVQKLEDSTRKLGMLTEKISVLEFELNKLESRMYKLCKSVTNVNESPTQYERIRDLHSSIENVYKVVGYWENSKNEVNFYPVNSATKNTLNSRISMLEDNLAVIQKYFNRAL